MGKKTPPARVLGLDLGRINTRASLFGISDGKYRLLGCDMASTSLGDGLHLGTGAGSAMRNLQSQTGQTILRATGGLIMPADAAGEGVDQVALTASAGTRLKSVLLGLSEAGSLQAGRALIGSLPLELAGVFGLQALADEPNLIDTLLKIRPEIIVITGGEDAGAETSVRRWVEIVRLVCCLLPDPVKPLLLYAGNPSLEEDVRRRLEPVVKVHLLPNLQPTHGELELVPAQVMLDQEIMQIWKEKIPGLSDLSRLVDDSLATKDFAFGRMARFLSRSIKGNSLTSTKTGVLVVDLGGGSDTLTAGLEGQAGTVSRQICGDKFVEPFKKDLQQVHQWAAVPVSTREVHQFLSNAALNPQRVPDTVNDLALSQAFARVRMQTLVEKLAVNTPWLSYSAEKGLLGHYEPVVVSGRILTQAPTAGQTMLMVLDGLQPWGVTTIVLDKHQILPLLGVIGEDNPILPVHVLQSEAFENLGTVVVAVSEAPAEEKILTIHVSTESGKDYSVDILQGTLRRLVVPEGQSAVLVLEPAGNTDVGFGAEGVGGRLKVIGGTMGVVVDARGRPLQLPVDDEARVEQIRRWLWILGG